MTPQSICLIGHYPYRQRQKTTFTRVQPTAGSSLLSIRHLSYSCCRGGTHHEAANTARFARLLCVRAPLRPRDDHLKRKKTRAVDDGTGPPLCGGVFWRSFRAGEPPAQAPSPVDRAAEP